MRYTLFLFAMLLSLSACTPNLGMGVGAVAMSPESTSGTTLFADTQTGIHGQFIVDSGMQSIK